MLGKFLNPKNDIAFKKIFGTEKNKEILIHFLNDMIEFKEKSPIKDVTFLPTSQNPDIAVQKVSIVDILCKDERGNTYIVEMQVGSEKGFEKRAQYYAAKAYVDQSTQGVVYQNLKEVIFLAIVDYVMFPNKKGYKSDHVILDRESFEHNLQDFSFTFLELPKFNKEIHALTSVIDKWAYFFKHGENISEQEFEILIEKEPIIEKAYHALERYSWNAAELRSYDQQEKREWAYRGQMAAAEEKGLKKGLKEGLEKGKVEGLKEGLEKGKTEASKMIAHQLLQHGLSREEVSKITHIPLNEL